MLVEDRLTGPGRHGDIDGKEEVLLQVLPVEEVDSLASFVVKAVETVQALLVVKVEPDLGREVEARECG